MRNAAILRGIGTILSRSGAILKGIGAVLCRTRTRFAGRARRVLIDAEGFRRCGRAFRPEQRIAIGK
jgi:hypothetical protein